MFFVESISEIHIDWTGLEMTKVTKNSDMFRYFIGLHCDHFSFPMFLNKIELSELYNENAEN